MGYVPKHEIQPWWMVLCLSIWDDSQGPDACEQLKKKKKAPHTLQLTSCFTVFQKFAVIQQIGKDWLYPGLPALLTAGQWSQQLMSDVFPGRLLRAWLLLCSFPVAAAIDKRLPRSVTFSRHSDNEFITYTFTSLESTGTDILVSREYRVSLFLRRINEIRKWLLHCSPSHCLSRELLADVRLFPQGPVPINMGLSPTKHYLAMAYLMRNPLPGLSWFRDFQDKFLYFGLW